MNMKFNSLSAARLSTAALALCAATPALATIDNTATATGSYGGNPITDSDTVSVSVAPATPDLTIVKTLTTIDETQGTLSTEIDAGDTLTFTFEITNSGNVTLTDVVPVDTGPTFNGEDGTGTMGAFQLAAGSSADLAPGETATYTALYTMSAVDVYNAAGVTDGVSNTATATGDDPSDTPYDEPDPSSPTTGTLDANPALQIVKTANLQDTNTNSQADAGEQIIYTYTVTNTGNVAISDITIADVHEGVALAAGTVTNETLVSDGPLATAATPVASSDAAVNASWDLLQPEAVITFTYTHTVTQTEVDDG